MAKAKAIRWSEGMVMKTFGLKRIPEDFPILDRWMEVENDLTDAEKQLLEVRRKKLLINVSGWNEETLKMKFIALILDMVDYDTGEFQGVYEAEMSAIVQGIPLKVIADFTVAKVISDYIEHPYFYFHEYKPKKKFRDPYAQIFLAMLIAQAQNMDDQPIYGCIVMGELWHFVVMDGVKFCVSKGLNATETTDLERILLILRKFKTILAEELAVPS